MAFDQSTRNRLARFVSDARRILTDEFTRQCKQDFGIDPDTGEVSDVARLTHLNDTQRATARILRETLDHYVAGSPSGGKKASIDRILREQAFTTLNRLCAVRMAEARGIVIESVGKGPQSKGFSLYARVAGSALGETADAYRGYLFSIFDELALDLPPLFDRFSPKGRLFPSTTALDALLAEINHVDLASLWGEDETIGWLYQYFNSIEERKQMRDESAAPRNSRELAVRNQFFTPRYVVEFLTDNTLGRIWYEMTKGETVLKGTCRYLVRRPSEVFLAEGQEAPAQEQAPDNLSQEELLKQPVHIPHRPLKDPREIRLLDPACGSMHFGLYAFDLFTTIYDEAWELVCGPADARPQSAEFADFIAFAATFKDKAAFLREVPRLIIEHNIHGIDIDPRAVQIAGLSLWLRAQRAWHQAGVKPAERPRITRSHIVCAEPMPGEKALLQEFVQQQFQEGERPVFGFLLEQVFDQMKLAGEAGSLLRIEESIRTSISEAKRRWRDGPKYEQSPLFPEAVAKSGQGQMRIDLSGITDEQFWERAEQRIYDALSAYSERAESGGTFQRRLFANDAAQGFALIDLLRTPYDAMVMNPPFGQMTGAGYAYARSQYDGAHHDVYAAFVRRSLELAANGRIGAISSRSFIVAPRLEAFRRDDVLPHVGVLADFGLGVMDDAFVESAAYVCDARGSQSFAVFDLRPHAPLHCDLALLASIASGGTWCASAQFRTLPSSRLLYSLPLEIKTLLEQGEPFEPAFGTAREGMKSFDNDRYLRLWWEVPVDRIGQSRDWVPMAKGGARAFYYGAFPLVLNWRADGAELKATNERINGTTAQVRQASTYWYRPGATYSKRSAKGFSARVLPAGCIFTSNGPAILPTDSELVSGPLLVGWLNARVVRALIHLQANAADFSTGSIKRLPWMIDLEPSARTTIEESCTRLIAIALMLSATQETGAWFGIDRGACVLRWAGQSPQLDSADFKGEQERLVRTIDKLVEHAYGITNVEWTADILEQPSSEDDGEADEDEEDQEEGSSASGVALASYLVGAAFGRWDLSVIDAGAQLRMPSDLFGPLPPCPPAQFRGSDGRPIASVTTESTQSADARSYRRAILRAGILVDEPGDQFDLYGSARQVLNELAANNTDSVEQRVCSELRVHTLREYYAKPARFFIDHLARYTKGRRQAPIYWPLSTSSGSYTLWLYYHRLTDQTLFNAINDFVEPKLQQIRSQAAALRGQASRSSADSAELERLSVFEIELTEFRNELLRLAKVWKPNLNDGVVMTAAPLWKLFQHKPWQKKLKETWESLEAGEYDWAHLACSLWPDRVREKCKHDKSLAIAHGLEELYQEPPATAGKKRGRKPKAVDPELMEDAE